MVPINLGTAFVEIRPDTASFGSQLSRGVQQGLGPTERQLRQSFRGMARGLGGIVAGVGLAQFFRGAIDEAAEAERVIAQTNAVIESTGGVAGISAEHVGELAGQLSDLAAVDDEVIQQGANLLLTFKNIQGEETFDAALGAALDLSRAMGTDLQGAVLMVGKALNDPEAGLGRLARAGVDFSDSQKQAIDQMLAFGNTAGAQEIILQELEDQFGGAAEANKTAADEMSVAWDNLKEQIGTVLMPILEDLGPVLKGLVEAFAAMPQPVQTATVAVLGLAVALGALNAIGASSVLLTIAKGLAAIALTPIGVVVLGLAATLAIMYGIWLLTQPLRDAFSAIYDLLVNVKNGTISAKDALVSLGNLTLAPLLGALRGAASLASGVTGAAKGAIGTVQSLGSLTLGALSGSISGIVGMLNSAVAAADRLMGILRGARDIAGSVGSAIPSGGGESGALGSALGGVIPQAGGAAIAVPAGGPGVVGLAPVVNVTAAPTLLVDGSPVQVTVEEHARRDGIARWEG